MHVKITRHSLALLTPLSSGRQTNDTLINRTYFSLKLTKQKNKHTYKNVLFLKITPLCPLPQGHRQR